MLSRYSILPFYYMRGIRCAVFANFSQNIASLRVSGDIAANLQRQVDELKTQKVNVSDKATEAEAKTGTDDTKWMSPLMVEKHFTSKKATSSEVSAGTNTTHWVSPDLLKNRYATKAYAESVAVSTLNYTHGAFNLSFPASGKITSVTWVIPGNNNVCSITFTNKPWGSVSSYGPFGCYIPYFMIPPIDRTLIVKATYEQESGNSRYGIQISDSSDTILYKSKGYARTGNESGTYLDTIIILKDISINDAVRLFY